MNDVLQLKGSFKTKKNTGRRGPINLTKKAEVTSEELIKMATDLKSIYSKWENDTFIGGALISVHHKRIVPKSCRLQKLLGSKNRTPNQSIVGARFEKKDEPDNSTINHVFTYFISLNTLSESIDMLEKSALVINRLYNGTITIKDTESINNGEYDKSVINKNTIDKYQFLMTVVDASYVDYFSVDENTEKVEEISIVTLYKTKAEASSILEKVGIQPDRVNQISQTTFQMRDVDVNRLKEKMPYLVAMSINDAVKLYPEYREKKTNEVRMSIPAPNGEPVIGVIDTMFYEGVYFADWVEYEERINENIEPEEKDYLHGTAISSIIVDGPSFNPRLEDGCGRFRVKHFGVAKSSGFSSFTVIKQLENIIKENRDIKVWNLSLGGILEINNSFISPEASVLDEIQYKYDVIFVVAGTNRKKEDKEELKIGPPADSLNSIVVNSVNFQNKPASYSRRGPVLSFFYKPDVCYYGGEAIDGIRVCEPLGENKAWGTSLAAPWITRKVAYLIYKMNLNREVAKALIIDAAAGWDRKDDKDFVMGYGIVPTRIEDVLKSRDDEIKFTLSGIIDSYEMYTHNVPVPIVDQKQPFYAKATMVYFPKSNRDQGVDYTNTELDIHFGRTQEIITKSKNGKEEEKIVIKSINNNKQSDDGIYKIYEENARRLYRKWDNVKHICEIIKERKVPKKTYGSGFWGISIKTKERLEGKPGRGIRFGVVVTLKEMNGVNRINEFINKCVFRGWIVNPINVESQLDVYAKAEEDIEFE